MRDWLEKQLARIWNRRISRRRIGAGSSSGALDLGAKFSEDLTIRGRVALSQNKRAEHIAVLGKTGSGKSFLVRYLAIQDLSKRGFVFFDLHGDTTEFLLREIATLEVTENKDLSDRLILVDPSDSGFSVGLNPLERQTGSDRFVQISELTQILRQRWQLDTFGARTDELLRNSLYVLAENGLTLLELTGLLAHSAFRASCLKNIQNQEVKQYFEIRYDQASEPLRATMREPILNKVSAFTSDPRFRAIVGQQRSTFSIIEAMDSGKWVILNLHKGRLGEQAATLGSLFLTTIKNALFARKTRDLFTLYCDEIQNLIAYGSGLETMLSEARKFGIGIVTANQFLEQYSQEMRAAIMAVGTHVFFQLSAQDAQQVSAALDGGKPLAELLKNLSRRHMVVKTGSERWQECVVPKLTESKADTTGLYSRSRARWAAKRSDIEVEIRKRQLAITQTTKDALDDWD